MPRKYNLDSEFEIRKMVKMVNNNSKLTEMYMNLYSKFKTKLGYHFNEIILAIIFMFKVEKSDKLSREYDSLKVIDSDPTKVLQEDSDSKPSKGNVFMEMCEEVKKMGLDEMTSTASAGSYAYATPKAFASKPTQKPIFRGGTQVKMKEDWEKTPSVKNAINVGKENRKNAEKDFDFSFKDAFKEGSYEKYLDYEDDTKSWDELPARRNEKSEDEYIDTNRGGGMEHLELDFPNEMWEKRRDEVLGKERAEKAEKTRDARKDAKEQGYPKVSVPVKEK